VVVNDGSTDCGPEIVAATPDPRIRLFHQDNGGVSGARNRGITEARAELIAFLDADDYWHPDFLTTIHSLVAKHRDCGAYATRYLMEFTNHERRPAQVAGLPEDFEGVLDDYFALASRSEPPLHASAVCVRKSVLDRLGGFPLGITSGEDLLTWAKLAAHERLAYSMRCCSTFTVHAPRFTPGRMVDRPDRVGQELAALLQGSAHPRSLRRYLALWHRMRASTFFRHGWQARALLESGASLYYNPFEKRTYLLLSAALVPYSSRLLPVLSR
jgi:glycosyltransferase involved in cell wall biosynthesis